VIARKSKLADWLYQSHWILIRATTPTSYWVSLYNLLLARVFNRLLLPTGEPQFTSYLAGLVCIFHTFSTHHHALWGPDTNPKLLRQKKKKEKSVVRWVAG